MTDSTLQLIELQRPYTFKSPFGGAEFAAWVVAEDASSSNEELTGLAEELVSSGCRYAVCSGHECSKWDDAVDWAYLASCPDYRPEDHNFVMTTWHASETLAEIAFFFANHTKFDEFVPLRFVVVSVGAGPHAPLAFDEAKVCLANAQPNA
ncbi:MAG: hypothetical protein ABIS07_13540 [Dokdonella sp.]